MHLAFVFPCKIHFSHILRTPKLHFSYIFKPRKTHFSIEATKTYPKVSLLFRSGHLNIENANHVSCPKQNRYPKYKFPQKPRNKKHTKEKRTWRTSNLRRLIPYFSLLIWSLSDPCLSGLPHLGQYTNPCGYQGRYPKSSWVYSKTQPQYSHLMR